MVKIVPPSPQVNTLDVDYTLTYAGTLNETWQIINFFLEELKPVETADLEPEDRNCPICAEDFTIDFHRAVRLPCNHCFGEPCIKRWLSPCMPWSPRAGQIWRLSVNHPGANTCLSCREFLYLVIRFPAIATSYDTCVRALLTGQAQLIFRKEKSHSNRSKQSRPTKKACEDRLHKPYRQIQW